MKEYMPASPMVKASIAPSLASGLFTEPNTDAELIFNDMRKSWIEMDLQNKPKHLWLKQQLGGEQVSPHGLSLLTGENSLWQTACHLYWSSPDVPHFKHWI